MKLVVIDFETYYDSEYSLDKMTTEAYVRDPRFEVIGVSVKFGGDNWSWLEEHHFRQFAEALQGNSTGIAVLAHHTHFDGLILSHHYGLHPGHMLDTMGMSRAWFGPNAGHSLDKLSKRLGLGEKGHEVQLVKGKHRQDFTQEEWLRYGAYSINDGDLCLRAFTEMMRQGFPREELDLIDTTVKMFTSPTLLLDEATLREYQIEEQQRKEGFINFVSADKSTLMSNDKLADLLFSMGEEPPQKWSEKQKKLIWAFAKTDPGFQDLLEHPRDEIRFLAEARLAVKSTINETRTARLLGMGRGGRALPVYLNYAKAHTFRWSGGDKVNWQNFERTNKKDPKRGKIRRAILAPPGYKIVVTDSAQIEARMTAWLANHTQLLEQFRTGVDVYSAFASEAFGRPINRKLPEDELPGFIGKCMVLGLGFGMSWGKFAGEMLKGMNGGPVVQFTKDDVVKLGIDVTPFLANPRNVERIMAMPSRIGINERLVHCAVANHFVKTYRDRNPQIVALWAFFDRIINDMAAGKEYCFGYLGFLKLVKGGIMLPSGLTLHYDGLERDGNKWSYWNGRTRTKIYGGLLTENIVQALARIVVANQMQARARKNRVIMMSHDEFAQLVPEDQAAACLNETIQIMKTPPAWAPNLPLNAEGGFGDNYGDAKT